MKKYPTDKIRNVGLFSHGGAGKTSLVEAVLYDAGITNRLGRVDDGTSTSDYDPAEIKRKISINSTIIPLEWNEHKINFIDTPGYADFVADVKSAIRVVDSALILLCAVAGVEVQTEIVWEYALEANLPCIFVVNKMDRENADFNRVYEAIRNKLSKNAIAVWIPLGSQSEFKGIIDLLTMKAIFFENEGFVADQIHNSTEIFLFSHRTLDRNSLSAEKLMDGFQSSLEIGIFTVKFIDNDDAGEAQFFQHLPDFFCADLNSSNSADQHRSCINSPKAGSCIPEEIAIAGGIDNVNLVTIPLQKTNSRANGNFSLNLFWIVICDCIAFVDFGQS